MTNKAGIYIELDGVPVDVSRGMTEAARNPPPGFRSKHHFGKSDVEGRIYAIDRFAHCGQRSSLDLTMESRDGSDARVRP